MIYVDKLKEYNEQAKLALSEINRHEPTPEGKRITDVLSALVIALDFAADALSAQAEHQPE